MERGTVRPRRTHVAVVASSLLLLLGQARPAHGIDLGSVVQAVQGFFGGGGSSSDGGGGSQTLQQSFGPIVVKTAKAMQYAAAPPSSFSGPIQLPLGSVANVTIIRPSPFDVYLAFWADGWAPNQAAGSAQVPFMEEFLYTAQAPTELLDAFMQLVEGPGTGGSLADAVETTMGDAPVLHIVCTGEGAAAALALLCGPWAGLAFPTANVDVIAFSASWAGFNAQFNWALIQLATLHYIWPFDSSNPALAGMTAASGAASNNETSLEVALSSLITQDSLMAAVSVPNLPPSTPPDFTPDLRDSLGSLAPVPDYEPLPSDCPVILCKTRDAVSAACFSFGDGSDLQATLPGLPATRLHAASGADAVVAWNASTLTGIIIFQGSESKIDWLQDAILFFSDDFRPGNLSAVLPGVKVHRGFLNQAASLTTDPASDAENITAALLSLSGGRAPDRLVVTGHSLGGALSELTAVWIATVFPNVSVLVTNTGAPRVGNDAWELEFTAVIGRAYRYVNHLDEVPELPPFDSFKQVPHGMWLRNDLVLLQDRPPLNSGLTWNDHHCNDLYVPPILNATAVTVPGWIYNATAAS